MLKRVLRKCHAILGNWIEEEPGSDGPFDSWAAPYTQNRVFVRLMEKEGCGHQYTWPALQAASLAANLGIGKISFIEFGVAGGNSLVVLERAAKVLQSIFNIEISVYGFDTGTGLPPPSDYRDMPNLWSEGFFPMDVKKLRQRLTKAQVVLGPVNCTVPEFLREEHPPVAFVAFDLDYYSSTMDALQLFEGGCSRLMPRVQCYFDDILGYSFCEYNGERLAISDFNSAHQVRKLAAIPGIRYYVPERFAHRMWEKYYMLHIFDHPLYARHDGMIEKTPSELLLRTA